MLLTEAHPRPAKVETPARGASISMGSLTPIKSSPILNNGSPTILGKRSYEQHNGLDGESLQNDRRVCVRVLIGLSRHF